MITKNTLRNILLLIAASVAGRAYGQEDSTMRRPYDRMSLKDLLNIKIVSASKETESLLEAPLSASVLTREEIERAGSTTIMEALRLIPGMIVREETNGNYDVELRGMDNVPPDATFDVSANTTTLVMIDGRPVYSYLRGGTFWETLPVALNDVERIEVVRGPSAALYGPNAVNGVINIITRRADKDGLYLNANMLQGSALTFINNAAIGYRWNPKWSVIASGNYASRDRTQLSYYEFNRDQYLTDPNYFVDYTGDTVRDVHQRYPDQPMAVNKYAGNVFVSGEPSDGVKLGFSAGLQHSQVQRVSSENEITPLSTVASQSRYADLRSTIHHLSVQLNYNGGTQSVDGDLGRKYNFHIAGGNAEYSWVHGPLTIKPSVSYSRAVYDDLKYADTALKNGLLNTRGVIETHSGALRSEYRLLDNRLRLVAALAVTDFNLPARDYWSYEFAATYKINGRNLIRAVYSRAPRSSNVYDTYISKALDPVQTGPQSYLQREAMGDPNTRLMTARMFELGYRGELAEQLSLDLELYGIHAGDYSTPVQGRPFTRLQGVDTVTVIPLRTTNLPLRVHQIGGTVSLHWKPGQFDINPFFTLQHTEILDFAPYANTPDAGTPNSLQENIYSGMGSKRSAQSTPAFYGGWTVNYKVSERVNLNMSAYVYTGQVLFQVANVVYNDGSRGVDHIPGKAILNASVVYSPAKGLRLFCTGKNLLNENYREFFKTDAIPFMALAGLRYDL
ncbi:MAG: TonB-dependent receptor [Bacteroidetes bacterium]|nr:TonB-dependent receptor [Bacteroidota bacterium]